MKRLLNKLEIDDALLWVLVNKFWSVAKGPISVFFIITYLTPEEQGLWYSFLSLGALAVFAELGFTAIITQFVSHEYAHLKEQDGLLKGDSASIDRIVSLIRYSLKFYLIIIPLAIATLLFVGNFFLGDINSTVFFLWMIFSVTGGIKLLVSLLQSIIQGFDKVALVQKNVFIGNLILPILNWTLLFLGFGLSTLVISNIGSVVLMFSLFYIRTRKLFFQIFKHKVQTKYRWFNEIIGLQWKYAVSWMAGYFVFQYMTPMLYKHEGAVLAGQFGLTIGLIKSISAISSSWIDTKIPKMNMLVAHHDKKTLDSMFRKNALIGIILFFTISLLLLVTIRFINIYNFHADSFLPLSLTFFVIMLEIPNVVTGVLAKYLRAHKAEPYYGMSVLMGVLFFIVITLLSHKEYNITVIVILLNAVSWFIILPIAIYIFKKFTRNYYKDLYVRAE